MLIYQIIRAKRRKGYRDTKGEKAWSVYRLNLGSYTKETSGAPWGEN